jgi:hypothetical protein
MIYDHNQYSLFFLANSSIPDEHLLLTQSEYQDYLDELSRQELIQIAKNKYTYGVSRMKKDELTQKLLTTYEGFLLQFIPNINRRN